jgi:hypothetical protein
VVEARLAASVRREVVAYDEDPRSPSAANTPSCRDLREVAYGTLARADRRSRHLAAVRHFESTGGDEITPIVADHYLRAHEATPSGPEADALAAQARRALRAAGERAAALHSRIEAQRYFEPALALTTDAVRRPSSTSVPETQLVPACGQMPPTSIRKRPLRLSVAWRQRRASRERRLSKDGP